MKTKTIFTLSISIFILAGCQTEANFNREQEMVSGSPAIKRDVIKKCEEATRKVSPSDSAEMAKPMNVSPCSNIAFTYCKRTYDAVASKRITYSDYFNHRPVYIRVLQGK